VAISPADSKLTAYDVSYSNEAARLASSRWLFAWTIFLGAFLLFLIEPLFAKLILPWFGGSAAVWATCLVFFQSALLLGYFYADFASRRFPAPRQAAIHIALLAVSLAFLPIAPQVFWRSHAAIDPAWRILGLLTCSIGLPFVLLCATSPLIQSWYARRGSERSPYPLFAVSNFASLVALLSFPFLIEPRLTSHEQRMLWSALYAVFVVCCGATAWLGRGHGHAAAGSTEVEKEPNDLQAMGRSVAGTTYHAPAPEAATIGEPAKLGRSMLRPYNDLAAAEVGEAGRAEEKESVPSELPEEEAIAPTLGRKFLWLSYAACGSMLLLAVTNHLTENVAPVPLLWVLPLAVYLLTFTLVFARRSFYPRWLVTRLLAVAVGTVAYAIYDTSLTHPLQVSVPLFCAALFVFCLFCHGELAVRKPAPRYLTSFYLTIALGGAVGAVLVGLVAPRVLSGVYELPIALILMAFLWHEGWQARVFWAAIGIVLATVFFQNVRTAQKNSSLMVRNFYGALRVEQSPPGTEHPYRTLFHGKIKHGAQFLSPPESLQPTTYYSPESGVGLAMRFCCEGPKRVGVIGLGTGTLAAYAHAGDSFRFYEINPLVVPIAREWFSYLKQSPAAPEIILGDARLSLEGEAPQQFDVLAIDAFSGDAIPVHLLTREAFALYFRHLKPEGILAVHTSNTYLTLAPVVKLLAEDAKYPARLVVNESDEAKLIFSSDWVIVTRNEEFLRALEARGSSEEIIVPPNLRVWTDDYNNLFQILRPIKPRGNASSGS
jgi:hypothetical protein